MALPLYLGAKPYPEFGDSDGSDDMEGEDKSLAKEMNSEKRRASKNSRSHKGSSDFVSFLITEIRLFALSRSADLVVKESKALLDCAWLDGVKDGLTNGRAQPEEALNGLTDHTGRGSRSSLSMKNSKKGKSGEGKYNKNQWGKLSSDDGDEYAALRTGVHGKGGAGEANDIKNRCNEFNNEIEKMKERFHRFSDEMKGGSAGGSDDKSGDRSDAGKANGAAAPSVRPRGRHPSQEDFFKFDSEEEPGDSAKGHFADHSAKDHSPKDDFFFQAGRNSPYGSAPSSDDAFAKKSRSDIRKERRDKSHSSKSVQLNTRRKDSSAFYFNFSDESGEKKEEGQSGANQLGANQLGAPDDSAEDHAVTAEMKKPSKEGEAESGAASEAGAGAEPESASHYNQAEVNLLLNELKGKFESEFVDMMIDKLGHKFHLKKKDKEKIFSTFRSNAKREKEQVDSECIKERYNALVKKKEDRQKNKLHEEIKEELKKVKEKSFVERNLNSYIKDNQLLNEYYIKKYSHAGEQLSDKESEEKFPQDTWMNEKKSLGGDEQEEGGALNNSNSVRAESHTSERSHSIVNLQYRDGSHVFAEGGEGSSSDISEGLTEQMGANRNADFHTKEGEQPRERVEQEEKKSDISDFTFMKRSSSGRGGGFGHGGGVWRTGEFSIQGMDPHPPAAELRVLPSNETETDLLPEERKNRKSISKLLLSEEQPKDRNNQTSEAIKTGKHYYQFICPLTPYELFLLSRFHKKGINEELKEFRNKKYLSCEKQLMSAAGGGICRTPLNVAYIKYKITVMKTMLRSSQKYIHEKKFKKGLKICIKNGEYIKNFVSSYCVLRRRDLNRDSSPRSSLRSSHPPSMRSPGEEPPYQYADFYLNVDSAYITMDELKNILKSNVRNIIVCKLFILIKEYKKYKYIENSSLILVLHSVLCRIVTSYTLLKKILKKFILLLFLRGCLSCVESMCSFLFLMYPKERTHPLVAKVYSLCRNSFLIYSTCYKRNKYAMINNYDLNFEQCVEFFSPEWGYYIYTTSNFNIFSSSVKFNGFLKRGTDFSAIRQGGEQQGEEQQGEQQEERQAICGMGNSAGDGFGSGFVSGSVSGFDVGDPLGGAGPHGDAGPSADRTQLPEDDPQSEPTNEGKLATVVDVCIDVDSANKKEPKKNDLYTYLTNYEKKKRSYYIIDDNMRRIEFTRKETNHNLETFLQMGNPNEESSTEQSKREQLDRLMSKVNRDVYLNSSGSSCTNATFLGHCPHCKHAFNSFTRSCKVCQRYVHVCYYLLVHCTYKYHCELCDATYSEKCLEKFSKGFTCFYCGLFFIR
ncbi:hypothetical protein PCYB_114690, partial [Plasmodium cynomolgi strain B]